MGSPDPPANFAAGRTLPYDNGRAQPQEFSIHAEAERGALEPAQIANLEGADNMRGNEWRQKRRFIVYNSITAPDSGA